jgi:hypothetical protein
MSALELFIKKSRQVGLAVVKREAPAALLMKRVTAEVLPLMREAVDDSLRRLAVVDGFVARSPTHPWVVQTVSEAVALAEAVDAVFNFAGDLCARVGAPGALSEQHAAARTAMRPLLDIVAVVRGRSGGEALVDARRRGEVLGRA